MAAQNEELSGTLSEIIDELWVLIGEQKPNGLTIPCGDDHGDSLEGWDDSDEAPVQSVSIYNDGAGTSSTGESSAGPSSVGPTGEAASALPEASALPDKANVPMEESQPPVPAQVDLAQRSDSDGVEKQVPSPIVEIIDSSESEYSDSDSSQDSVMQDTSASVK